MAARVPLISVVMPVYNGATYLGKAVESILNQTEGDFEFLIFDDESRDGSGQLLRQYAQADPRIKFFAMEHRGYGVWLQKGVEDAAAPCIARMDADDIAMPDRFARQLDYLQRHPECVAVGGQVMTIDADGDPIGPHELPSDHDRIDALHMRACGGQIIHPAVMMRTDALRAAGGYRAAFEPAEDLDLFLRLAEAGRLANLDEVVLKYRMHLKSVTHVQTQRQQEHTRLAVAEAHARRGLPGMNSVAAFSCPTQADVMRCWIRRAFNARNYATARKYAWRVVRQDPLCLETWRLLTGALMGATAHSIRDVLSYT